MSDQLLCSREPGLLHIAINRPAQRNALDIEVLRALRHAFQDASEDPFVRVVTLTGAGERVFCAGADLKASLEQGSGDGGFGRSEYRTLLVAIRKCSKPTIALARGHVLAGGLGLLLACDLALACDDIYLSTPEINVGMFPMMVLALLARHVGRKKAAEMLMLGERVTAAAAKESGILNDVFPRGHFEEKSASYVRALAAKSPTVLRLGKQAMLELQDRSLDDELLFLERELGQVMATDDSREGLQAFLEKREPRWKTP